MSAIVVVLTCEEVNRGGGGKRPYMQKSRGSHETRWRRVWRYWGKAYNLRGLWL